MKRRAALPLALLFMLLLALALRPRASAPDVDLPTPPSTEAPAPLPDAVAAPPPRTSTPPAAPPAPERLRPWLEKTGRAALLRDVRRLAEARASRPEVYESDLAWIAAQLRGDLFAAAGAAELLTTVRPAAAVAAMAPLLAEPGRRFLKDVLVERLARAGGDAAAAALVTALRDDAEEDVRARCASALRAFQGPEAFGALAAALRDPAVDVRRAAAAAMRAMNAPELFQTLVDALAVEPELRVQTEILATFDGLLGHSELSDLALGLLPPARRKEVEDRRLDPLQRAYPLGFFTPGREAVPFGGGRRIGLTVELGPGMRMEEVAQAIFREPPFDRYREWFYLRNEAEFPSEDGYDFLGRPLRGVAGGELDGTVYLRFRDPAHFEKGVLGYARGCEAFVQKVSLLHELGHALGGLGDEYRGGSPPPHPNVAASREVPWAPLVRDGHLPQPFAREEGVWVPAETCHMNNNAAGEVDYCSACQLALMRRIAELSGAPWPAR